MQVGEKYPDGSQSVYRYDIFGRIIAEIAPNAALTQYTWDEADRLISIKQPNGEAKHYQYNAYGKPTSIIDEHGLETRYEYLTNTDLVGGVINPDGSHCVIDTMTPKISSVKSLTKNGAVDDHYSYVPCRKLIQVNARFDKSERRQPRSVQSDEVPR